MRRRIFLPLLVALIGLAGPLGAARAAHCGACRFPVSCPATTCLPTVRYHVCYQTVVEDRTCIRYRPVYQTVLKECRTTTYCPVYEQRVREHLTHGARLVRDRLPSWEDASARMAEALEKGPREQLQR